MSARTKSQQGVVSPQLLFIAAAVGLILYVVVSSTFPFKDKLFGMFYPKPSSFAVETITLNAVEDTYVSSASKKIRYGNENTLVVNASPTIFYAYFKFDLTPLAGKTITSASLKFKTTTDSGSGSVNSFDIPLVDNSSWRESSVTWQNRPAFSSSIGTFTNVPANSWYTASLQVPRVQSKAGTLLSLAIRLGGGDQLLIRSSETTEPPQLVINYETDNPVSAPTPTSGNLLSNPGFETTLTPWGGWQGSAARVSGGHGGSWSGQVSYIGGTTPGVYTIGNGSTEVTNPTQGQIYQGSTWIRGSGTGVGKQARLVIRAGNLTNNYETYSSWVTLTSSWQQLSATHTVANAGMTYLDIYVVQNGAVVGDAFLVDDFSLTSSGGNPISSPSPIGLTTPFHPNSIWNKPISTTPVVLTQFNGAVSALAQCGTAILGIDWGGFAAIYPAGSTAPRRMVSRNGGAGVSIPVPEPVYADPPTNNWNTPEPGIDCTNRDCKIMIQDLSTNRSYDFYRWTKDTDVGDGIDYNVVSGGWNDLSSAGDGLYACWNGGSVFGGRAAGWPYSGGAVTLAEMQAALAPGGSGYLNHALSVALPKGLIQGNLPKFQRDYPRVWPARSTDGFSQNSGHFIMGQRLQLDPSVNVDALNLSPGAKVLARTLQRYGAWISDSGSGAQTGADQGLGSCLTHPGDFKIQVEQFLKCDTYRSCLDAARWSGVLGTNDLAGLPKDRLRVVDVNKTAEGLYEAGPGACGVLGVSTSQTIFQQVVNSVRSFFR